MKTESREHLEKARLLLAEARGIAAAGYANAAGQRSYLAALHGANALVHERTDKTPNSHKAANIMFSNLVQNEPSMPRQFQAILPQTYDLKAIADYELGPSAMIPIDRVNDTIERVDAFLVWIEQSLSRSDQDV